MGIEAVLLDSGDTLVHPLTGEWTPCPAFLSILDKAGHELDSAKLAAALARGWTYLNDVHSEAITGIEEEVEQFTAFYRIVLDEAGIEDPAQRLALELATCQATQPLVRANPDAETVLARIREAGLRLAVVSNSWPSLRLEYERLGLTGYFEFLQISAEEGCAKPDVEFFQVALRRLGLTPQQVGFVDDFHGYVEVADKLGMKAVHLGRGNGCPCRGRCAPTLSLAVDAVLS